MPEKRLSQHSAFYSGDSFAQDPTVLVIDMVGVYQSLVAAPPANTMLAL
jgi:hypothetical protein